MNVKLPPGMPHPELDALLESVREHEMTTEERFEQRVSWVYGMLGENSTVTKDEIRARLMEEMMAPKSFKKAFEEAKKRPEYWKECARLALEGEAMLRDELRRVRAQKDGAYLERNQVVALVARMAIAMGYTAGIARTAIEGWAEDWHGCVYIDLPTGQASWHYHDSQAYLFDGLPPYVGTWDGHSTPEKYRRIAEYSGQNARAEREEMMAPRNYEYPPAHWQGCSGMGTEGEARTRELLESTLAQNARLVAENQRLRALLSETRRETLPWRA